MDATATPPYFRERARLNALRRYRDSDDPAIAEAQRDLEAAKLEEHIRQVVDGAPPLSGAQRERLALLLNPGDGS